MIIYVIVVYIFKKYIYTYSQPQTIAIGELHIHINIYIRLFFPEGLLHISHSHGFRKDIPQHKSPMVTHPGHPGPLLRQVKDLALYAPSGPKALAIHVRPDQLSVAGSRNQSASLVSMLIYANVFLCFYMFPLFHIDMGWYGCLYIYICTLQMLGLPNRSFCRPLSYWTISEMVQVVAPRLWVGWYPPLTIDIL